MKLKTIALIAALAIPSSIAYAEDTNKTKTQDTADTSKTTDTTKTGDTSKTADAKQKLTPDEVKIVAHMHHVNMMEVKMGKLAQQRGTAAVKRYGEQLVRDHSTADKELAAFAKKRGLKKIPMEKPTTEVEKQEHKLHVQAMANLKKLRGAEFDREYLRMMVDDHEKELARTDVAMASATDPDLKAMLDARKPVLQRHADAARDLQKGQPQAQAPADTAPAPTGGKSTK